MGYVDEKIALLEKANRQLKKEELKKDKLEKEQAVNAAELPELTLEELREGIKEGKVVIEERTHEFEEKRLFDNKLPMVLMKNFFDDVQEGEKGCAYTSSEYSVTMLGTYLNQNQEPKTVKELKKELEKNFGLMGMYVEIVKDMHLDKVDYVCFRTPTSKGWLFNIIMLVHHKERRIVCNFNCLERQKETYGLLLEAIVNEINDRI